MATITELKKEWGDNPYIGPRTFSPAEAHKFFGRDREARDLIGMIVSHRTMLFYAQSGAGKSSLINAKVIPGLANEGFEILPVCRVSGQNGLHIDVENIFVYNLISSLHREEEELSDFSSLTLSDFLDNLVQVDGVYAYDEQYEYADDAELKPRILLIDQFEEILTTNTPFWEERDAFFQQLAEALALDDQLWVVIAMREDFIAGLDPYCHYFDNALQDRYYMQQLDRDSALEAITKPALEAKRPFTPKAADILVDNLREIQQKKAAGERILGAYVEPVQLQAVCYQMWEKLKEHPSDQITELDVEAYADVSEALINFYEDTIADTVMETAVSEPDLRNWFDVSLITQAGTRNMVYRGEKTTGELPTPIADYVKNKFILRENVRSGGVWYELVHDRFVQPILKANREWKQDQPLIQLAQNWADANRDESHLMGRRQVAEYTKTDESWKALGALIIAYVEASRKSLQKADALEEEALRQYELEQQRALVTEQKARAEDAEQATSRQKTLARVAMGIGVFAIIASIIAFLMMGVAQTAQEAAETAQETAVSDAAYAAEQSTIAFVARETAVADRDAASTSEANAATERDAASTAEAIAEAERDVAATAEADALLAESDANANREQLLTQVAVMVTAQVMAELQEDDLNNALAIQVALLEQLVPTPTPAGTPILGPIPTVPVSSTATPTPAPTQDYAAQLEIVYATQTAVAIESAAATTILLGASHNAVPIEAVRFGNGPNTIVLGGGIHSGWAPSTVDVAKQMIDHFTKNGQDVPENISLYVIADMNPDSPYAPGEFAGRLNANSVDLNRNWDCNWSSDISFRGAAVDGAGGEFPLSETETLALSSFLQEIKPMAVVLWYAKARNGLVEPGGCPDIEVSHVLADIYVNASGYSYYKDPVDDMIEGDAANWIDLQGIPAISVTLPDYEDADFDNNLTAVYALLDAYAEQ